MADIQDYATPTLSASLSIASVPNHTNGEELDAPSLPTSTSLDSVSDNMTSARLKVGSLLAKYGNVHNNNSIQQPKVNSLVKSFSETPLPLSAKSFITTPSSQASDDTNFSLRQSQTVCNIPNSKQQQDNSVRNNLTKKVNNGDDCEQSGSNAATIVSSLPQSGAQHSIERDSSHTHDSLSADSNGSKHCEPFTANSTDTATGDCSSTETSQVLAETGASSVHESVSDSNVNSVPKDYLTCSESSTAQNSITCEQGEPTLSPTDAEVKDSSRSDVPMSDTKPTDVTYVSGSAVHTQTAVDTNTSHADSAACAVASSEEVIVSDSVSSTEARAVSNPSSIFTKDNDAVAPSLNPDDKFCLTCHEGVKSKEQHSGHEMVQVSTAITNQTTECDSLLENANKCMASSEQWSKHISHLRSDLVKARKSIAVELDDMFREIEHKLHERKMVLLTQLTDCTHDKESYLSDQIAYMANVNQQLSDILTDVNQVKKEVTDTNLIAHHCHKLHETSEHLHVYTDSVNSFSLSKNTHVHFERHGIAEVRRALNSMACVSSSNVVPSKCTASGDGIHKAHVNRQTFVKVTPRNCQAQVDREKGLVLEAQLYNEEVNVECQCIDNGNGTYNVLYIAPEAGQYRLAIRLFNQHIKGSPYTVNVVPGAKVSFSKSTNAYELRRVHQHHNGSPQPVKISKLPSPRISSPRSISSAESFSSLKILPISPNSHSAAAAVQPPHGDYLALLGQYGRKKGDFSNPQGVTMDHNGRIYCTDSTNQNIQMFTGAGSFIGAVGKRGREVGQLLRPIGICCSKDGCLLFTDYEKKCINVFKDGAFIRRIGQGKLIGPKGITTTPRGSVVVADNKGNQVLEFSINGRLIRKIQSIKNDKATHFAGPHYVAVSQSGDIYVSDFHNHCVKVFNKDGDFLKSFGQHGSGNGQFNAPTGVTIDQNGHVLVSDWGNSRIQIFDEDGSFLAHVDTSAAPLFGPQSIHATIDNRVIVADSGNHCVKVFRYDSI